jgi:HPt (histidine-containing phosphotransfer) domain-containing protein
MLDATSCRLDTRQIESLRSIEAGLVREIVGQFLETVGAELAQLRAAADAADAGAVWHIAHKLKGSCSLLGALSMTAVLQRVEACGRVGTLDSTGQALELLEVELAAVRPALERELAAEANPC